MPNHRLATAASDSTLARLAGGNSATVGVATSFRQERGVHRQMPPMLFAVNGSSGRRAIVSTGENS